MKLRSHVQLLVIGTLLPMVAFAIYGAVWLTERERNTFERGATERVRAVLTAVDRELASNISTLMAIASRGALAEGNPRAIHAELVGALASQPDWSGLSLADPSGRQLANARYSYGAPLPDTRDRASLERVVITGKPAVGDLVAGVPPHEQQFSVRVPVLADGTVKYVLSAAVDPKSINDLIIAQRLPPEWVGVVLDGSNRFVARTLDPQRNVGQLASESLREALTAQDEGWFHGTTVEGVGVYTPFSRSPTTRWSVALGIPGDVVNLAHREAVTFLLIGTAVAGLIAFGLAAWLGRRFWDPITGLAYAARGIGQGAWPAIPVTVAVDEVAELGRALRNSVEELRRVSEGQRQAIEQLRVADRAKDDFLAMLGHELRNPMAGIAGASSILSGPRVPDDMAERARTILRRQVENLSRLVDDMLDVSRSVAGKITLIRRPVDLSQVVNTALNTFRSSGRLQNHDVSVDSATAWIDADEVRMEQVVANLIGNAVKFTPAGGCIVVKVEARDGDAVLTVADSGRGIPANLIDKVFDPFVQGGHEPDRAQGGLGLGLALVKALVELHGGTVSARSDGPGLGSRFIVRLPRIQRAVAGVDAASESGSRAGDASRRILIIEDNPDGREMLRALLTMAGHEVHESADGPSGLAAAAAIEPDLVLIDIGLPGMEGHEVARRIRAWENGKSMRLIAISGYGQAADRRRSLDAGFDAHLTKPFSIEALGQFLSN